MRWRQGWRDEQRERDLEGGGERQEKEREIGGRRQRDQRKRFGGGARHNRWGRRRETIDGEERRK